MIQLDLIETLAFGGLALMFGFGLRKVVPLLARYNLPAPVLGGLSVAVLILIWRNFGEVPFKFDTTLQTPLMIAFFTTIGFGASVSLLRTGGPQVFLFLVLASVFAVAQNLVGIGVATAFGLDPLFGVLASSVTLTGGPATGLAFAPLFEEAGVPAASSVAVAAAMAGIVSGGIIGGPVGTHLIERFKLPLPSRDGALPTKPRTSEGPDDSDVIDPEEDQQTFQVLKSAVLILVAMWMGGWLTRGFDALGLTLPAYIGAMLVAAAIRNLDDFTGWLRISHRTVDVMGAVALSLFLVLALMTLRLWELARLALPLVINIVLQVVLVVIAARWLVFKLMGRDYESAVMSGGFIGFMMGTTANAMAVMSTLTDRYGPAPRAYLVAPMVGAFFIDFTNALIITGFLNVLK